MPSRDGRSSLMYQDYKDLLSAFQSHGVKYLVVGGFAVIHHSQPRFTKDMDLFIKADPENAVLPRRNLASVSAGFVLSQKEYWDQLPSLSSESKKAKSATASLFAPGLSLWIFSRDTLFCLYNEVSYPGRTHSARHGCRHPQTGM